MVRLPQGLTGFFMMPDTSSYGMRDAVKAQILEQAPALLDNPSLWPRSGRAKKTVNGRRGWICPLCGHGERDEGLIVNVKSGKPGALICFDCNFSGDVIALYMKANGRDYNEALKELAGALGIDGYAPVKIESQPAAQRGAESAKDEPLRDYGEYCQRCRDNLRYNTPGIDPRPAWRYLEGRRIDPMRAAGEWLIGYDPDWRSPTAIARGKNPPASRRIIAPTYRAEQPDAPSGYVARAIGEGDYKKMNEGRAGLFNPDALRKRGASPHVFIVEGIFDALSVGMAGYPAVALNSTSNIRILLDYIDRLADKRALSPLLRLDSDEAGRKAAAELAQELAARGIHAAARREQR